MVKPGGNEPFPDFKEDLAADMKRFSGGTLLGTPGDLAKTPDALPDSTEGVKASAWRTWGEPARLLLDTEEALGIGFARLLVIDLLRHNHLGTRLPTYLAWCIAV